MLMIADNAALSLFNTYLSRDVVRSWILKSNECPLLLLKCLINPKQRYARLKSSSAVDNAPPNSSYPNPVLYEKGSGTFLFAGSFAKRLLRTGRRAKAGYHRGGGILPFALICLISRSQHPLQYSLRENSP